MVSKVIWSPRALEDLREIAAYIGKSSPIAAARFCGKIIEQVEALAEFPHQGRIVREKRRETLREVIIAPYRIAYEVQADRQLIEIMTIWHSARGVIDL